jgi:8-oxo-dGTP diphosphatase
MIPNTDPPAASLPMNSPSGTSSRTVSTSQVHGPNSSACATGASSSIIEVAAGLIFRDGRLLITQRRPGDHLAGLWEFPGGKREPGESYELCLQRELREELGLEIQPGEMIEAVTHSYPEKTVHLRFFRCVSGHGEPQLLGCQAVAWVKRDELQQYCFPAADEKLLETLRARTELWGQLAQGTAARETR